MAHIKFKDFKIKTKQIFGFGIILFILTAVNLLSIYVMRQLRHELEISSSNSLPRAMAIADINYYSSNLRIAQLQLSLASTEIQENEHNKKISELIDNINQSKDTYETLIKESKRLGLFSQKEREFYDDFDSLWDEYLGFSLNCVLLFRENETMEAINLLNGDAKIIFDAYSSILTDMVSLYDQYLIESVQRATNTFIAARKFTIILLVITIIISLFMAYAIVRLITIPVGRLESAALAVSEGDLWVNVKYRSKDELGTLATTFNNMINSLREAKEKTEEKSAKLKLQWDVLRETNDELQEKSALLEQQKQETEQKNADLENTLEKLKEAQNQLVQSEKMASVGQLTAGIAHEINNPINFVSANIKPLKRDVTDVIDVLKRYEQAVSQGCNESGFKDIEKQKNEIDFDYLLEEIDSLLKGIEEGANRTTEIVRGLRNFSRLDEDEQKLSDIQQGIDSTLMVLHNELKNKVDVKTEYGQIPQILCYPGKLNQVFLNILQNANHAIEESGTITIKTWLEESWVFISIKDDGNGMKSDVVKRIFEPFYTTKDVGKGTGLGLAISYGIIQDHDGDIEVRSKPGNGSEFIIKLPYKY